MVLDLHLDITIMYKKYYQKFLSANPGLIHMASHSHHYWPDSAIQAHEQYALDTVKLIDNKWAYFFESIIPKSQNHICGILNFDRPNDICFASNTHELLYRLYSSIESDSIEILTSTDEFHSASRQFARLDELENVTIKKFDLNTNEGKKHLLDSINKNTSMIFISHVFYNSGKLLDWDFIEKVVVSKSKDTIMCLDGYHSFCAIELDISSISDNIFFMAGGYKYAQAGEGMCFITLPKDCQLRPKNTGWFASFETLDSPTSQVSYSNNGMRFAGSTRDFSAHYRFNAVWDEFKKDKIDLTVMNTYVKKLQIEFINEVKNHYEIAQVDTDKIGRFVTINFDFNSKLMKTYQILKDNNIMADYRGNSLRFGFAPYLSSEEVLKVTKILVDQKLAD